MAIGVTARLTVQEGKNEEFEGLFLELQDTVNKNEDGCSFYALHKSKTDPQSYMVLEQYVDEEAATAHGKTEYFIRLSKQMGGCMAAAPEVELFDSV